MTKSLVKHKKNISLLIERNKEQLLDSHLKYGGIYLCIIEGAGDNGNDSLEVELDDGNLAFTYSVTENEKNELFDFVNDNLREQGIGCYTDYNAWEESWVENIPCLECGRTDLPLHFDRKCGICKGE